MELSSLLALPPGLEVAEVSATDKLLTVHLKACAACGICPLCGHAATHVRCYYTRFVDDVPCAGQHVQLVLRVRKFRCDTVSCPRKIFVERLGPFIEAWARKTTRLREAIEAIGLSTCGEVGARLASRLAIATSPTTILRRIMDLPLPPVETVTHLGIDDFALRRGRTYGTVLVDLKRHKVLDLLPDRKTRTAKVWIQAHPEIELASRDRAGEYASAARSGAPQAIQTADRFHLVKNLVEAVQEALAHCGTQIRKDRKAMETASAVEPDDLAQQLPLLLGLPAPHPHEVYYQAQSLPIVPLPSIRRSKFYTKAGFLSNTVSRRGRYVTTSIHAPDPARENKLVGCNPTSVSMYLSFYYLSSSRSGRNTWATPPCTEIPSPAPTVPISTA